MQRLAHGGHGGGRAPVRLRQLPLLLRRQLVERRLQQRTGCCDRVSDWPLPGYWLAHIDCHVGCKRACNSRAITVLLVRSICTRDPISSALEPEKLLPPCNTIKCMQLSCMSELPAMPQGTCIAAANSWRRLSRIPRLRRYAERSL